MTPRVVFWQVRFLENGQEVGKCYVETVNRLLARMLAYDACPQFRRLGIQTKVSRAHNFCPAALPGCSKKDYASK